MTVIFSCPHPLHGEGPGRPLTKVWEALVTKYGPEGDEGLLTLHPGLFPEVSDTNGLGHGIGPAFDELALERIEETVTPSVARDVVFVGGGGASLNQMEWLYERDLRSVYPEVGVVKCGTLWFSSHYAFADRILKEEYPKYGMPARGVHPYLQWRSGHEQNTSAFMIVPSEFCRGTYPVELRGRIHVAEFGVDSDKFHPPVAGRRESDKLRIVFPGTNPVRKGLFYLIEAAGRVAKGKLAAVATGGLAFEQAPEWFKSPGWLREDAMPELYQNADVMALPSLEEGQALASLEAAASGCALIVTPNVGLPSSQTSEGLVSHEPWGIVVPTRNSEAIRYALQYLVDNPGEVKRMGQEARKFAEARTWARFQARIVEIVTREADAG